MAPKIVISTSVASILPHPPKGPEVLCPLEPGTRGPPRFWQPAAACCGVLRHREGAWGVRTGQLHEADAPPGSQRCESVGAGPPLVVLAPAEALHPMGVVKCGLGTGVGPTTMAQAPMPSVQCAQWGPAQGTLVYPVQHSPHRYLPWGPMQTARNGDRAAVSLPPHNRP